MSSKLFVFDRPLPAPFDKGGKKVKVSSTYGDGTEATLSNTVVKAVLCLQGWLQAWRRGYLRQQGCCRVQVGFRRGRLSLGGL